MDRRTYLAIAAAVTAGCGRRRSGGGEPSATSAADGTPTEMATRPETSASTAEPTPTGTSAPATLTVTELSVPSTVQVGLPVEVSATVENAGGREGTASWPVEARLGTGDWTATDAVVEATVPPGETVTATVELPGHPYVEPASYRLADAEPVGRTRFVARQRSVGEAHRLPNGVALSLEAVEFRETYTYRTDEGEETVQPTDGERWLVGTVRAENVGEEAAEAPLVADLAFFRGEEEYAYQHLSGNLDRYEGGELAPGEVSAGDLPSDVPVDATRADLRLAYDETFEGGRVAVYWPLDSA